MPFYGDSTLVHMRDLRAWEALLRKAGAAMLAAGWTKHAGKFRQVQERKALILWRLSQAQR